MMTKTNSHISSHAIVNWFHSQIIQTTKTVNHGYYRNASFIAHCRRLQPSRHRFCHSLCDSLAMDNRRIIFTVVPIHDFCEWPPFSFGTTRNTQHFFFFLSCKRTLNLFLSTQHPFKKKTTRNFLRRTSERVRNEEKTKDYMN